MAIKKASPPSAIPRFRSTPKTGDVSRKSESTGRNAVLAPLPGHGYLALVGMSGYSQTMLFSELLCGLKFRTFEIFRSNLDMPSRDAAALVQIPWTTLVRRKEKGRLDTSESDRLLRMARLLGASVELRRRHGCGAPVDAQFTTEF